MIHFFFLFLLGETMLRYWNAPLGLLGGHNVHQIIPVIAYDLANKINIAALDTLTSQVDNILKNTPFPGATQFLEIGLYFEFTGLLILADGVLFVLTLLSFVAIGIGTLVGPLLVPFILVPRFNWLFYNWLSYTIKYSFYQVVANALTFIWANAFVFVINNLFGGNFALAHAATEILGLFLLSAGMLASICLHHAFRERSLYRRRECRRQPRRDSQGRCHEGFQMKTENTFDPAALPPIEYAAPSTLSTTVPP